MDPNACLEQLRALAQELSDAYEDENGNGIDQDDAIAFVECFNAIDDWLTSKGFLPKAWER